MEMVVHIIGELAAGQRSAAEQLVGHALRDDQQLVIQVVGAPNPSTDKQALDEGRLPDWCNVYEGLSDNEIAALEQAISQRLDLTRPAR
jgi:hypothetical protein